MTSDDARHREGDHRFVTIPTALTEVTFQLTSANTSTNDTSATMYFDNVATGAFEFDVVADQAIQIVGVNETDFTDAIPVTKNMRYHEDWGSYTHIKIKTTVDNTQISIRVR